MACHALPDYFGFTSHNCAEAPRSRVYIRVMVALAASVNSDITKLSSWPSRDASGRGPAQMTGK